MLTINYKGTEYELSTSLRVAYKFQSMNNHAPYGTLLTTLGEKSLEDQISLIYCALQVANPFVVGTITQTDFLNYVLDNYKVSDIMRIDGAIITGIYGGNKKDSEGESESGNTEEKSEDETFPAVGK